MARRDEFDWLGTVAMCIVIFLIVSMLFVNYRLHFVLIPEQEKKDTKLIHTP